MISSEISRRMRSEMIKLIKIVIVFSLLSSTAFATWDDGNSDTTMTIGPDGRDYTSFQTAIQVARTIPTSSDSATFLCDGFHDATTVHFDIDDWVTNGGLIRVVAREKTYTTGVWQDDRVYTLEIDGDNIDIEDSPILFDGIQMLNNSQVSAWQFSTQNDGTVAHWHNCMIINEGAFHLYATDHIDICFTNNICIDTIESSSSPFFDAGSSSDSIDVYIYNSLFSGQDKITDNLSGYLGKFEMWNCIVVDQESYAGSNNFNVTFADTVDYSTSDTNNTPKAWEGSNNQLDVTPDFRYLAGYDFHLALDDSIAIDNGKDFSATGFCPFEVGIDRNERPVGSAWDIGPVEYIQQYFYMGRGYADAEDSYMNKLDATANYGTDVTMWVMDDNSATGRYEIIFGWAQALKDSIVGDSVAACTIWYNPESFFGTPTTLEFEVRGVLELWDESEVSFDTARSTVLWATAGAASEGNDITSAAYDTLLVSDTLSDGDYQSDVTALLQTWDDTDTANANGFLIRPISGSEAFAGILFYTSEHTDNGVSPLIKIVIGEGEAAPTGDVSRRRFILIGE